MSHLPMALLVSVTIVPAYVLFRAWRVGWRAAAVDFIARCACACAIGLGVAAVYLVPALALEDWISAEQLWRSDFQIENWFVVRPDRWLEPFDMKVVAWLCAAYATLAMAMSLVVLRLRREDPRRRELGFWTATVVAILVLLSGLVPWFWRLPEVAKVQFPWRLMVAVEFAAVTAFCLSAATGRPRAAALAVAAAIVLATPAVELMARSIALRVAITWHDGGPAPHDVKEYMPAGFPLRPGLGYGERGLEPTKDVQQISCAPAAMVCEAVNGPFGAMRIMIDSATPTTVVLRRFFFPAWHVDMPVAIVPTDSLRLVSFGVPAGRHELRLERRVLPAERWGMIVSGLSVVLLAVWTALGRRKGRP